MNKKEKVPEQAQYKESLLRFFAEHPMVGLLGTLASVIGLLLSVVFYLISQHSPYVTAEIWDSRVRVFDPKQTSALSVSYAGEVVSGPVTAVQIYLSNQGETPVRRDDILQPIRITLSGAQIVEALVKNATRPSIQLSAEAINTENTSLVEVAWKILEKGDGGWIQIVYLGDDSPEIQISGAVVGQRTISIQNQNQEANRNTAVKLFLRLLLLLPAALAILGVHRLIAMFDFVNPVMDLVKSWPERLQVAVLVVLFSAAVIISMLGGVAVVISGHYLLRVFDL